MANKKWYVRDRNSSRHVNGFWIYYLSERTWTTEKDKAESWRTKKAATAFCEELGKGEVYGE